MQTKAKSYKQESTNLFDIKDFIRTNKLYNNLQLAIIAQRKLEQQCFGIMQAFTNCLRRSCNSWKFVKLWTNDLLHLDLTPKNSPVSDWRTHTHGKLGFLLQMLQLHNSQNYSHRFKPRLRVKLQSKTASISNQTLYWALHKKKPKP